MNLKFASKRKFEEISSDKNKELPFTTSIRYYFQKTKKDEQNDHVIQDMQSVILIKGIKETQLTGQPQRIITEAKENKVKLDLDESVDNKLEGQISL